MEKTVASLRKKLQEDTDIHRLERIRVMQVHVHNRVIHVHTCTCMNVWHYTAQNNDYLQILHVDLFCTMCTCIYVQ